MAKKAKVEASQEKLIVTYTGWLCSILFGKDSNAFVVVVDHRKARDIREVMVHLFKRLLRRCSDDGSRHYICQKRGRLSLLQQQNYQVHILCICSTWKRQTDANLHWFREGAKTTNFCTKWESTYIWFEQIRLIVLRQILIVQQGEILGPLPGWENVTFRRALLNININTLCCTHHKPPGVPAALLP